MSLFGFWFDIVYVFGRGKMHQKRTLPSTIYFSTAPAGHVSSQLLVPPEILLITPPTLQPPPISYTIVHPILLLPSLLNPCQPLHFPLHLLNLPYTIINTPPHPPNKKKSHAPFISRLISSRSIANHAQYSVWYVNIPMKNTFAKGRPNSR